MGVAGAVVQLGYGFVATAWPYPTITDPPYEVTWAVVNIGMVATVVGLALLVRPRFGRLALAGAALAIAGHLARIMVAVLSAMGLADEGTAADGAIVVSILGMFGGMAILAVATVRGHVLQGWRSWLPSAVVATGLVTAAFYSIDRPAYFVMLGLLWGVPWLMLAIAVRSPAAPPTAVTLSSVSATRRDAGLQTKAAALLSLLLGLGFWCPGGDRHRLFRPSRLGVDVPGLPHPWRGAVHRGRDPRQRAAATRVRRRVRRRGGGRSPYVAWPPRR